MKIKRKVEMNLPQLIEWGFKNDVINKEYVCNEHKAKSVIFNLMGWAEFSDEFSYNPHDTFTIEVEEEITEDRHLDYLYALTNDDEKEIHRCMNFTIKNASMVIGRNDLTFFTLVGNDLVKIYENGKLVE